MKPWRKKEKAYKGPIIDMRGMIRLVLAALPFLLLAYFSHSNHFVLSFLCAAFTSASFVGFERTGSRFRYALWVTGFVFLAVFSAWQVNDRPVILALWLVGWSIASSLSFAGGPVVSFPASVGCVLYILLLLGNRLGNESFWGLILYSGIGIGWSFFLGTVSAFTQRKNEIILPTFEELKHTLKSELYRGSTYLRTGVVRGILLTLIGIAAAITKNTALIITLFTVLIAMQPGRSQTTFKVLTRVASAVGAVVAAGILLNIHPPLWVYITTAVVGGAILFAGVRWILLRSYTYNSFFLSTFPLFIISLGGYSDADMTKVWYTLLGGLLAVLASEIFVFHYRGPKDLQKQG